MADISRFTDRARQALSVAGKLACDLDEPQVETEHLLVGLRDANGVAATVLNNLGVQKHALTARVYALRPRVEPIGSGLSGGRYPRSPQVEAALDAAVDQSKALGQNYVGTEHLLIGLVCDETTTAAAVLAGLGVLPAQVRAGVLKMFDQMRQKAESPTAPAAEPEPKPETWCILSQFGHTRHAGRLSEQEMFGEKFGRIDIPQPDGSFRTRLFGGKSVFDIEIVTEQAARTAAMRSYTAYIPPWDEPKALPEPPERLSRIVCRDCGDMAVLACDNNRCARHCDDHCDTHCERSIGGAARHDLVADDDREEG